MSKIKQLGKDISIYGLGIAITKMIHFLLVPVYTRVFSLTEYGTLNLYTTVGEFIAVIFSFQISMSMLRYYYDSEEPNYQKEVVSSGLLFLLGISMLLILSSFLVPEKALVFVLKDAADPSLFRLMIINNALLIIYFYLQMLLRVQRNPKLFSIFTALQIVLSAIFIMIYVFVAHLGIKSVFLGNITGLGMMIGVLLYRERRLIGVKFNHRLFGKMFIYGFVLMITVLGVSGNSDLNRFILLKYMSVDDIGLTSLAIKVSGFVSLLITAFHQAWSPFVYSIMNQSDSKHVYSRVLEYFSLLFVFIALLSTFAPEIIYVLAPGNYSPAARLIPFQLLGTLILAMVSIVNIGIHIKKKPVYGTISVYAGLIVNTVLLIVLLNYSRLGLVSVPIAFLAGNILQVIMMYLFSQRLYHIDYKISRMIMLGVITLIFNAIMTFFSYGLPLRLAFLVAYCVIFVIICKDILVELLAKVLRKRGNPL
jgi:O-antigen/teichoic acid export membrane protein